jgi:hypothetical protein
MTRMAYTQEAADRRRLRVENVNGCRHGRFSIYRLLRFYFKNVNREMINAIYSLFVLISQRLLGVKA